MDRGPKGDPTVVGSLDLVVTVGTDHHPFDRLVRWVDNWCDANPDATVVIQRGTSEPSRHGSSRELISYAELCDLFAQAKAVVSHGGPATVMDALGVGRLPIVVARDPELGEHVDGHQLRFAEHLSQRELAVVASDEAELFAAIDRALADPSDFTVAVDTEMSDGVARFADVVDEMLGATNPVR